MSTLICTVGGSHQPIIKAIQSIQPSHVIFVCSKDNEASNTKGSYQSVEGKGNVNKSSFNVAKADLPNIITLAQLNSDQCTIIKVDPDDLNECYFAILNEIDETKLEQYIADYTGGTKTMTSAIVMVATDYNLKLNLIVGTRSDHIKVQDGSEESYTQDIQHIRFERQFQNVKTHWQNYAYKTAIESAKQLPMTNSQQRANRELFTALSKAFAAWDCFDHVQAKQILDGYKNKIGKDYGYYLTVIKHLIEGKESNQEYSIKYTPYLLADLWHNAQRKAVQGNYDDAIARIYRMLEWTAQWILLKDKGWETSNLPDEAVNKNIGITTNRQGQQQAGLYAAWQLVGQYANSEAQDYVKQQLDTMMDHIKMRNQSILAHGFSPITQIQWNAINTWAQQHYLPFLQTQAAQAPSNVTLNIAAMQLPQTFNLDNA